MDVRGTRDKDFTHLRLFKPMVPRYGMDAAWTRDTDFTDEKLSDDTTEYVAYFEVTWYHM